MNGPWIETEFEMSERTARKMMSVAEVYGKSAPNADLALGAIYELAAPSTPQEVRDEIERRIKSAVDYRFDARLPWLAANADVLGFSSRQRAAALMRCAEENGTLTLHLDPAKAVAISRKLCGNDNTRGTQGTGENEWYTPAPIIEAARRIDR